MKAIQIEQYGGPEVLQLVELEKPTPHGYEVLIEVKAIGVNYADTARREGAYVLPTPLPFIPGAEVAGVVVAVGDKVKNVAIGSRVVTLISQNGYAEYAIADSRFLIPVPEDTSFETAVAIPLQGLSAYHVIKTMGQFIEGESILIHASAGGVGSLAVQLARIWKADKIIATASSSEKLSLAMELGATHGVDYTKSDWEKEVLQITEGRGVDVALEMVGGEVFYKTLKCLAPFGRLVIYGVASGEQARFYPSSLMAKNQSVVGFFLPQIMKKQQLFQSSLQELLQFVASGELKVTIGGTYSLSEAMTAHRLLQSRQTKGKLVLIP
ncbi:alcohol dehydrogenase [Bacillus sp. HMF5848]|uniref:quinone oxidoreductase family protein n=1 Tax=Bacillus sp. HMF5848 TaxID=2495421 RepID=UPI000F78C99D|nr:zinc-binding dehydrogenase [Bacillus sp. HMF5848]RSK27358.1 alcohol dehydrogenase [Bacillus sp. HMF5848]